MYLGIHNHFGSSENFHNTAGSIASGANQVALISNQLINDSAYQSDLGIAANKVADIAGKIQSVASRIPPPAPGNAISTSNISC